MPREAEPTAAILNLNHHLNHHLNHRSEPTAAILVLVLRPTTGEWPTAAAAMMVVRRGWRWTAKRSCTQPAAVGFCVRRTIWALAATLWCGADRTGRRVAGP